MRSNAFVGWTLVISIVLGSIPTSGQIARSPSHRQIRFKEGQTTVQVRAVLKPETDQVYRFRARAGQNIHVHLVLPGKQKARPWDVVFVVQHIGNHIPGTNTQILEGVNPHGEINWLGKIPVDGDYEIWVSNPEISDRFYTRPIRYILEVSIN
ncbi:MAG TPA: hypothetical protein VGV87_01695 [Blastocatellia bacterium]|jgi:hypothetical protein|nr:hypothetical protein [Blastocatellia bacterium]